MSNERRRPAAAPAIGEGWHVAAVRWTTSGNTPAQRGGHILENRSTRGTGMNRTEPDDRYLDSAEASAIPAAQPSRSPIHRREGHSMKTCITQGQQATRGVRRIACIAALGMAFTFALPHAAHAQVPTPPPVPDNIRVLPPDQVFLLGRGVGTQNYECQPSPTIGQVAWTLFTPQATLFNDQQRAAHYPLLQPQP